jgi:hypothetical protein
LTLRPEIETHSTKNGHPPAENGDAGGAPDHEQGWIAVYVRPRDLPLIAPSPTLITQFNCLSQLGVPPERFKRDARNGKFRSSLRGKLRTAIHEDAASYYSLRKDRRSPNLGKARATAMHERSAAEKKADEIRQELRLIRTARSRRDG